MKLEEEIGQENFIPYVESYYDLTPTYEQKGIRKIHHDLNKQNSNRKTSYHEDYFRMTFSQNSNGLSSAIMFNCVRNKQENI